MLHPSWLVNRLAIDGFPVPFVGPYEADWQAVNLGFLKTGRLGPVRIHLDIKLIDGVDKMPPRIVFDHAVERHDDASVVSECAECFRQSPSDIG